MTRIEAENIINNYRDFDDETGEEYGYSVVSYEGTDTSGNHLFKCKADGEIESEEIYHVYAVTEDERLVAIPT